MNYLALFNGAIVTDLIIIIMTVFGLIHSDSLKEWYNKFSLGAVISDVFSCLFGIMLAHFIYPYVFDKFNLVNFIILAIIIQVTHDILFGLLLKDIPLGKSNIMDLFNKYKDEHGMKILGVDAAIMISAILIYTYLSDKSTEINMFVLITSLYLLPYFLYSV